VWPEPIAEFQVSARPLQSCVRADGDVSRNHHQVVEYDVSAYWDPATRTGSRVPVLQHP